MGRAMSLAAGSQDGSGLDLDSKVQGVGGGDPGLCWACAPMQIGKGRSGPGLSSGWGLPVAGWTQAYSGPWLPCRLVRWISLCYIFITNLI